MMPLARMVAGAALLAASAHAAELTPAQFAAQFEIVAPANGPFFRVQLPADVFRFSRSADLADLRLFNAAGELLPFALYAARADKPEESAVALPVYPIEAGVLQAAAGGGRMEIRRKDGATVVVIEGDERGTLREGLGPARVAAFLLDARAVKARAAALELDADFDRAKLVPISVQASRDLKHWRTLASAEPLFRLGEGAGEVVRTSVRLARAEPLDGEFLRLSWSESAHFALRSATLKTLPAEAPSPPPPVQIELGAPTEFSAREAQWAVDTPLRFAQLAVRAAETNTLAPLTVMGRPRAGEPWRAIGRGVIYRIVVDGEERYSPALQLSPGSYAGIKLVLDDTAPPFGSRAPAAAVLLPPHESSFLARGDGPFVLAIGLEKALPAALPLPSLVPGYQRDAERAFALAALGAARIDEKLLPRRPTLLFGFDSRTVTLWAVLGGAVLLLSAFAFSLLRKADRAQRQPPNSTD